MTSLPIFTYHHLYIYLHLSTPTPWLDEAMKREWRKRWKWGIPFWGNKIHGRQNSSHFSAAKGAGKRRDENVEIQGIYMWSIPEFIAGNTTVEFFTVVWMSRKEWCGFCFVCDSSPLHWRPPTKINGRMLRAGDFEPTIFFSTDRLVVVSRTFEDKNVRINYEVIPDDLDED